MEEDQMEKIRQQGVFDLSLRDQQITLDMLLRFAIDIFPSTPLEKISIENAPMAEAVRIRRN